MIRISYSALRAALPAALQAALAAFALLAGGASLAACGLPCDAAHVCAIDGTFENELICDGKNYFPCDYSIVGRRIQCTASSTPKVAVCSASGWTFENK